MGVKGLGGLVLEPTRSPRAILLRLPRASFETRLKWDAVDRPGYAYGTYQAALQARALGLSGISVIEMGVAGGQGLLALESHARAIQPRLGIKIHVFAFAIASAFPDPLRSHDIPY